MSLLKENKVKNYTKSKFRLLVMEVLYSLKPTQENISTQVNFRLFTKKYISNRSLDHKEFKYDHRIIEIYNSSSKNAMKRCSWFGVESKQKVHVTELQQIL